MEHALPNEIKAILMAGEFIEDHDITVEADVLRDEGEAYANKLREAGCCVTAVRFQGIIHDFVMLNALKGTAAARAAIPLATSWLCEGFSGST